MLYPDLALQSWLLEMSNPFQDFLTPCVTSQLQKVEKLGPESWSGVAAVDKNTEANETSLG